MMKKNIQVIMFDVYGTLLNSRTYDYNEYREWREDDGWQVYIWECVRNKVFEKLDQSYGRYANCVEKIKELDARKIKYFFDEILKKEKKVQKELYKKQVENEDHVEYDEIPAFRCLLETMGCLKSDAEQWAEEVAKTFRKACQAYGFPHAYHGVKEMLSNLKADGYQLGILSNAQAPYLKEELGELYGYFDENLIFISSEYHVKKPSPEFYKAMQKAVNVPFDRMVMVGDYPNDDWTPAKALGMHTVCIDSDLVEKKIPTEAAGKIISKDEYGNLKYKDMIDIVKKL